MLYALGDKRPRVHETAFIAPGAHIIGDVTIGPESGIWFNAVLRGDEAPIVIGTAVNVQDNSTLHMYEKYPLILEDEVSVGHNVILHGCHVKRGALVGMGSVILDGVEIGEYALIGANTFIPSGKKIPPYTLVLGAPGKVVRELTEQDLELVKMTTRVYREKAKQFRERLTRCTE
ncbi:MAG: gamma carbonic anhydrase family protein [Calditerricola sp.]|nr:gamma carbonic anhydrase family protein [Calditerricola sp.]